MLRYRLGGRYASVQSLLPAPPTQRIALQEHSQLGSGLPFATYTVPQQHHSLALNFGVFALGDKEFCPTASASLVDQSSHDQIEHMLPDRLDLEYPEFERESFSRGS